MKRLTKTLTVAVLLAALVLLSVAALFYAYAHHRFALPRTPYAFTIAQGSTLSDVARQLADAGVVRHPLAFTAVVRLHGKARHVKAGNYLLQGPVSPIELFHKITQGDVLQTQIVFIEGRTFRDMRAGLDAHPGVTHVTLGKSDAEVMRLIGAAGAHPEGLFFPDTYFFSRDAADTTILARAHAAMRERLNALWPGRQPGLPLKTPYEALILASIIEKETAVPAERARIAAVFVNRLRLGMKLQTDPTVIYGLGSRFDGNLRRADLTADGAYNTYTRPGMPPTPIAMPGADSLRAALHPAASDEIFFVAKGDGSHHFSVTLEEHNRAVARYQQSPGAR